MIGCQDCTILKPIRGGLKLGGRIELEMILSCPCPELRKLKVDEPNVFVNYEMIAFDSSEARVQETMKICSGGGGPFIATVYDFTCSNYDLSLFDMYIKLEHLYYQITPCNWTLDGGYASLYFDADGFLFPQTPIDTGLTTGIALNALFTVNMYATSVPVVDPPIVNFKIRFDPV